jgi:hypothetical protein
VRPTGRALLLPASLAVVALLLALNYLEPDVYPEGSPVPPPPGPNVDAGDPFLRQILPETFTHGCDLCGPCAHPVELVEARREASLTDHDGWYRLFWAGDDTYWYDDPVFLVQGTTRRTAGPVQGRFTIRARTGPAAHGRKPPHPCGEIPAEIDLEYDLGLAETPPEESDVDLAGYAVPSCVIWIIQGIDSTAGRQVLCLFWKLRMPVVQVRSACPCSS